MFGRGLFLEPLSCQGKGRWADKLSNERHEFSFPSSSAWILLFLKAWPDQKKTLDIFLAFSSTYVPQSGTSIDTPGTNKAAYSTLPLQEDKMGQSGEPEGELYTCALNMIKILIALRHFKRVYDVAYH